MSKKIKTKLIDSPNCKQTINTIETIIDEKLSETKTFIPMLLTIVVSLIAFLMLENFPSKNILLVALVSIIYLLIAFLALLIASIPFPHYNSVGKTKDKYSEFKPWNVKTYMNLSETDFLKKIEKYIHRKCTPTEITDIFILKQKINEFANKFLRIQIAYTIIIIGTILLFVFSIITLCLYGRIT